MMEEPTCPATPPLCKFPDTPPRVADGSSKSSSSRWNDSTDMKEKARTPSPDRPTSPENCAICLGPLTDKSFTNSCCHQFCYVCLREWSKVKAECPLCKVAFGAIIHNVRSQDDYDIENIVREPPRPPPTSVYRSYPLHQGVMALVGRYLPGANVEFPYPLNFNVIPHGPPTYMTRGANPNGTSAFRRSIYQRDLWARLQPDITGRYRECSPEFYAQNPAQLHRLIPFLNRELNVLLDSGGRTAYVMEKILELLPVHSIQSTAFRTQVARLIGHQHAPHFCHELRAFASSPYDMVGYDRAVQYHPNGGAGYSIEIDDVDSSDAAASGADDDDDILIIENGPTVSASGGASTSASASASTSSASHSESSTYSRFPQRISSSIAHTSVVNVSSDSESDVAEDIQIVGYVKPRHERTPEIITLSSPEHPGRSAPSTSTAHASSSYGNQNDDPISIRLGNNTSTEVKWKSMVWLSEEEDDDDDDHNNMLAAIRQSSAKKKSTSRRRSSSESSFSSCSEEDKRKEKKKRHSKHRKSKRGDKSKSRKDSKSRKRKSTAYSSNEEEDSQPSRKRKSTAYSSNEEEDSQPSTSKGRSRKRDRRESFTPPKIAQSSKASTLRSLSSDFSESDHSSQKSVLRSAIVQNGYSNRYSSADEDTSSHASGSKVSNLVMTRTTTDEGLASWIVSGRNSSSDSHRNHSDRPEHHRSSHHSHSKRKKSSHSDRKRRERSRSPDDKNVRKKMKPITYSDDSETS